MEATITPGKKPKQASRNLTQEIENGAIDGLHRRNTPGCRETSEGLHDGDRKGKKEPRYQPAPERRDECQSKQEAINDGHKASYGALPDTKAHLLWRRRDLEHGQP
jgi:hypothetical protein